MALSGVAREMDEQRDEPEGHGDGAPLSQHPAVAGPDADGEPTQEADTQRADPRAPATQSQAADDVVIARIGEHLEEADDTDDAQEARLEHAGGPGGA